MIPYLFKSSSHDKIENYIATSSIGAPSLGVAGLPLFPENSELPIISITSKTKSSFVKITSNFDIKSWIFHVCINPSSSIPFPELNTLGMSLNDFNNQI
jgi:hypothetical protein